MSFNPANGSSSVHATSSRSERLPFPQTSHSSAAYAPHRHPAISGSASSSHSSSFSTSQTPATSTSASNKDRPLTSAYLLKVNADAHDPKLAALEQAVTDRNALSSQNAQLWKLIEKQRAGYNQILKELERIRGERDALKAHINSQGTTARNDRRHRGSDTDKMTKKSSSDGSSEPQQQAGSRPHLDQSIPRLANQPQLHSSRSHEPLSQHDNQSSASLGIRSHTLPLPPPPSSAPSAITLQSADPILQQAKSSPAPLVVPSRLENLPVTSPIGPPVVYPIGQHDQHLYHDEAGADTMHLTPAKAIGFSQSPGFVKSVGNTNDGFSNATNQDVSPSPSPHASPSLHFLGSAPQTAPVSAKPLDSYPTITRSPTSQTPTTPANAQIPSAPSSGGFLTTVLEAHPRMLSRDSRISLPDEARQYIANMVDSPVPSPQIDVFSGKEGTATRPRPQLDIPNNITTLAPPTTVNDADSPGRSSEFLDLNEDDDEEGEDDDHYEEADDEESATTELDGDMATASNSSALETPRQPEHLPPAEQGKPRIAVGSFHTSSDNSQNQPGLYVHPEVANSEHIDSIGTLYSDVGHVPLENPYSPPGQIPHSQLSMQPLRSEPLTVAANFRALPLLAEDLPYTTIAVSHSFVRPNDRGKEVLSFVVFVDPGNGKEGWKVEKMYSDVLGLDQRVRTAVGKGLGKKIISLPEGKLWKDHAPAKVDQRKLVLENYLQSLIRLPGKAHSTEVVAFFTSDVMREAKQPVMQVGHKEGYLTKRGKNFGGWKTRYFVLQGPVLEYYDCRGGTHLGSILITGAQIGRQQRTERASSTDEEKEYRHAFLIVEAKKGPGGSHPRHVLCAESDEDRDAWVEILVRYFTGMYSEEPIKYGPPPPSAGQPRLSTSSSTESPTGRRPSRGFSKDEHSISKGGNMPISLLTQDQSNSKLFPPPGYGNEEYTRSSSPSKLAESPIDPHHAVRRLIERGQGLPSSLPDSSPLSSVSNFNSDSSVSASQRSNSELGHYADMNGRGNRQSSPERHRGHDRHKSYHPSLNTVVSSPVSSPIERGASPEKLEGSKVKISGPMNGAVIPSGFKFGKESPSAPDSTPNDRRIKSRSFWGFGKPGGDKGIGSHVPRAVFNVPLEESLDVAQIANLPAIVFRSIQYLEAKKAEQEEGIYRLSGSTAVIKSLKDRFNMGMQSHDDRKSFSKPQFFLTEGDVDLLASDEYWDPHAIAGLLKSFLRELPASILTRDLHLRFLAVIDFVDPQERIRELSRLIAALPLANYSLLRALTAHLILIVQNSSINKMTMRNVGIVFSPTLGIPAGVFSLMLGEFNRVFNVDAGMDEDSVDEEEERVDLDRRNSKHYSDTATDQLLGLTGRSLKAPVPEAHSDNEEASTQEESGAETTDIELTVDSSSDSGHAASQILDEGIRVTPPDTPTASKIKTSKASHIASTRGLNVNVTGAERGNRVLFICFNVDHRLLWGEVTKDAIDDGFQFYTTFFNAPPAIKALLHGMVGVGLVGLISKLHQWDDSAMFFDGTSLVGYIFSVAIYLTVTIPGLRAIVAPLEGEHGASYEDKVTAIQVLAAGNIIIIVCLGAILVLQAGQEYARRAEAKEEERKKLEKKDLRGIDYKMGLAQHAKLSTFPLIMLYDYDDTNWCLDGEGPFCSDECRNTNPPSQYVVHNDEDHFEYRSHWSGNDPAGIHAWAADIPPGSSSWPSSSCSSSPPSSSRSVSKTPSPKPSRTRLPKLLRSYHLPGPPALGFTAPTPMLPSPTNPITTARQSSTFSSSVSLESLGSKHSLLSAPTDSSLATPASTFPLGVPPPKPSFFGTLATHVRSWVAPSAMAIPSSPPLSGDCHDIALTKDCIHSPIWQIPNEATA
ncbi:hypothetical protein H0H93_006875 [Arthromyces matolae]|nr:hypothetical protein H0H93_006875 [Arthromyces matolae]